MNRPTIKVRDLKAILNELDDEMDIAVPYEEHDYWGTLYRRAERAEVRKVEVDGPKEDYVVCLVIQ